MSAKRWAVPEPVRVPLGHRPATSQDVGQP